MPTRSGRNYARPPTPGPSRSYRGLFPDYRSIARAIAGYAATHVGKAAMDYGYNKAKGYITGGQKKKSVPKRKVSSRVPGRYKSKVVAKKPKGGLYFEKQGVVSRTETGGTYSDAEAMYIGHSTVQELELTKTVFRALVKRLFGKAGADIQDFNEAYPAYANQGAYIQIQYRVDPDTSNAFTTVTYNIVMGNSYDQIATGLQNAVATALGLDVPVDFREAVLFNTTSTTPSVNMPVAKIDLSNAMLHFRLGSVLKIQNTTLANSNGTDPNRDVGDDVEANPIQGYLYRKTKWGNYIDLKGLLGSGSTFTPVLPVTIANRSTGLITFKNSVILGGQFIKPPNKAYQMGCQKQGTVIIQPGEIKTSTLLTTAKMSFNTFAQRFSLILNVTTDGNKVDMGHCAMFGLEKTMDGLTGESAEVGCQYQIDNTMKVALLDRRVQFTNDVIKKI